MGESCKLSPGDKVDLKDIDPGDTGQATKEKAERELAENLQVLDELGYRLYAEGRQALLIVLQGMDTAGKDGVIRHVIQAFNAQSCAVTSFKQPSAEELSHDFLWRIAKEVPRKGHIGVFNRSQYEDVLIVRVHNLVPQSEWETRYERINAFEKLLVQAGTTIVKIFLHISKDEQRERLQARLDDPSKLWKFAKGDLKERTFWKDYQKAYEAALERCGTKHAPWHVVPANHKWYRNLAISRILRKTLEEMNPHYPPPEDGLAGLVVE